ncbi:MAG: hypothetical protein JNK87_21855 [Bryobacterales bacterium]|nr:hypothetical protein [Bryobacterales bacterium]
MMQRLLSATCMAVLAASCAQAAGPWVKSYVVSFYDPAFRFGGRPDYTRGTDIEPGIDCPHGSTTHFAIPAQVAKTFSLIPWRTPEEVEALANPPATGTERNPAGVYFHTWRAASAYRGYRRDIETYINPFAAEDPGQPQVTSRIGEGFNLDGKVKDHDFVSPDGEKGIDNQLYRAWGCDAPWRGADGNGTLVLRSNDKMLEGLYTVVIRISGNQDPRNDDDATLEIGYSPDQIMKDARGNVGIDYSYRILKSEQYTKLKAKVRDGVVETEQAAEIHMPQIAWFYNQQRDAFFRQGKICVVPNDDGTAAGLVGGYRDWRDVYTQNIFAQSGGTQGVREHEDHVALYYALRRHADGMFNPKTGRYDGISSAYRLKLVPAFVVDPDKPMGIPPRESEEGRRRGYDDTSAATIKAIETLIPQPVPPTSMELRPVDGVEIGVGGVAITGRGRRSY